MTTVTDPLRDIPILGQGVKKEQLGQWLREGEVTMRSGPKKMHRMSLTVETKTHQGGCLKHVCEDCRADVHRLASIAERLAILTADPEGVPSPFLEETYELIVRLGLVREKINPEWGPPASLTLGRAFIETDPEESAAAAEEEGLFEGNGCEQADETIVEHLVHE